MPPKSAKTQATEPSRHAVELSAVLDRLEQEAAKLDAARGGVHKFNNVRRYNGPDGANWTANFGARGITTGLRDCVQLTEMRLALLRVQAEMPQILFD